MKSKHQIQTAINEKREEKRAKLISWATQLIDETSETMYTKLESSYPLGIDAGKGFEFEAALKEAEVSLLLVENGLEAYSQDFIWYLRFAD